MRLPKTETELKLYRQSIIKECKEKYAPHNNNFNHTLTKLKNKIKSFGKINILIGIFASIIFIIIFGAERYFYLILSSIIWITFTSTVIYALLGKNKN